MPLQAIPPTSTIVLHAGPNIPLGWLMCDGQAVSRTTYAYLFGEIGTTFGIGDGATTFNVPDLRGRFPLGVAAAGTGAVLGESGGAIDHTHGIGSYAVGSSGAHSHVTAIQADGKLTGPTVTAGIAGDYTSSTDGAHVHGFSGSSGTANPPYLALYYIIRT